MNKLLKNTLLMAVSFGIIGAGLAVIDVPVAEAIKVGLDAVNPGIAEGLGITNELIGGELAKNSAGWMGTFFTMFGAASVLVPATIGKVSGLSSDAQEKAPKVEIEHGKGVSIQLEHQLEPESVPDAPHSYIQLEDEPQYTTKIRAERVNGGSQQIS